MATNPPHRPPTTPGAVAPEGERRKRPAWLLPLLALLALALLAALLISSCGNDDDKNTSTNATGPAAALLAGDTDVLQAARSGGLQDLVGQQVTTDSVTVQSVVAQQGFTVGESPENSVYVEYGGKAGENEEGATFKPEVGQKVRLSGPIRPAPQDPARTLKINGPEAELVSSQGGYINADSAEPAK